MKKVVIVLIVEIILAAALVFVTYKYVIKDESFAALKKEAAFAVKIFKKDKLKNIKDIIRDAVKNEFDDSEIEEIASRITPGSEDKFISEGNNFIRAGNYREALKYYNAVLKANPEYRNPRLWHNRAVAKIRLYDFRGAVEDASISIEISPTHYAYYNRINAYYELNEWQNALNDINVYIGNNWDNKEDFYIKKGYCLIMLWRYEEAIDFFNKYEQNIKQEDKRSFYTDRGYSYEVQGKIQEAMADYAAASSLGSQYAEERLRVLNAN